MEVIKYLKQADFPYLNDFLKKFRIDNQTVFAYDNTIFANHNLPPDIEIHELKHLERQNKIGADKWIKNYLERDSFRLSEELIAYQAQLQSIKDREFRNIVRLEAARNLSSELYGNLMEYSEALKKLI